MGKASSAKRDRNKVRSLWHFTSRLHLPLIIEDGFLKTTDSNRFLERQTPREVVWLLDGPDLGSLNHGLAGSALDKTEVRIEVRTNRAVRWREWLKTVPHDAKWQESLVRVAGGPEAAARWWVAPYDISAHEWVRIEMYVNGVWHLVAE